MRQRRDTIPAFAVFTEAVPPQWRIVMAEMIAETWASNPTSPDGQTVMRFVLAQIMKENGGTPPGPLTRAAGMLLCGTPDSQKGFFEAHGALLPTAVQAEFKECLSPYGKAGS